MRVLYVEDNLTDTHLAKRVLTRNTPQILVDTANTLTEARSCLAQNIIYDLVLCDFHLPDGNGLELLSEIREQNLPLAVVILTGQGDEEIAVAALKAGADDYLAKRNGYLDRLASVLESALVRFRAEAARKAGKLRVLYVENNTVDIDLTRRHLEKHAPHIRLEVVVSPQDAMQKLPRNAGEPLPYDILLLDFHLPGENALEVLKILHDERHLDLPVVLVTAQGDEEVAAQALRLGASDYLVKHKNYLYELPAALENAFHRARLAREQAALRESETRYRLIVENSTFGIAVHVDNKIIYANKTASNTIGAKSPQELYGRHILEFMHPDERPMIMGLIQKALDPSQDILSAEPLIVEERLIKLDGSIIFAEASVIPIDYYGKSGLLVMMNEITQRKLAEKAIQESEAKFRSYIEHAPLPIFVTDQKGVIVEFNKAAEELLGYDYETLMGISILDVTSDQDRETVLHDFGEVLDQGYVEGEYRLKKRDGGFVWVNIGAVRLNDDRVVAFCQDVTERKAAEQALRDQVKLEDQLAKITASVPGMISTFRMRPDGSTCMPYSSPALDDLYGLQPEEVFEDATPALSLIHPADIPHVTRAIEDSARNLTPFRDEWRVLHPRRGEIWVEGHTMPLREADGGTLWHGFIQDITERKHAQQMFQDRETQYRTLVENIPQKIFTKDRNSVFLSCNEHMAQDLGIPPEQIVGLTDYDTSPKEIADQYRADDRRIMESGRTEVIEEKYLEKGRETWVQTTKTPIREKNGAITGILGIFQDITARKLAEESLRKSEERYRFLFENMLGGYAFCQLIYQDGQPVDFVYLEVNNAFDPMTGLKNVIGRKITEIIPGIKETNPEIFEIYARVAETGKPEKFEDYFEQLDLWLSISVYSTEKGTFVAVFENISERKRAANELRQQKEILQKIFDNIPLMINLIAADGSISLVNRAWENILGWTLEEIRAQNLDVLAALYPDPQTRQEILNFLATSQLKWADFKTQVRDGQVIDTSWCEIRLSDGTNIGIGQDITERKQAEAALKSSEENYRSLIENSESAIAIIDRNGRIHYSNPSGIQVWKDPEIVGKTIFDIYPTEYAGRYNLAIKQVIDTHTGLVDEVESLINGQQMWFRISMSPLRNPDGTVTRLVLNAWDITERRQAEEELRRHRDHLEELVEQRTAKLAESEASLRKYSEEISDLYQNAPCGYHSLDANGTFLRINDTELGWLGYSREEIIGQKKLSDLLAPGNQIYYQTRFTEFKKRGNLQNFEQEMIRKDGTSFPVLVNATSLFDEAGNYIMSRETLLDNTERIRAEKALREGKEAAESANRAKSTFLANMSHEIRTPMNAILGFSQFMLREPDLSGKQEQYLNIINRSGEHLLDLINDILEMSKIEADREFLNLARVDLYTMIHDLEMMFKMRTNEKNIQFKVELDPVLPCFVTADGSKLRQIFINLLGNAVKFTNQGGIIWRITSVNPGNGQLCLQSEVEDTGPGIAPEEIGILFKTFGQTSGGIKVGGGTGLGLAISSKFAQMMGGDLTVSSKVGEGSTFRLEVDVERANEENVKSQSPAHQPVQLKKGQGPYRILVVDDQVENRLLATEILEKAGFIPKDASNGKEAVEITEDWKPHLILMDIRMPVMDGYEAIRRIKETTRGHSIPIIAVTASAFTNDEKEVLKSGANAYVRKPYKEEDLFQAIEVCLGVQLREETNYRNNISPEPKTFSQNPDWLPADFPADLIIPLRQAILTANMGHLLGLIDQVGRKSPQIAERLRQLANEYQYDVLLELIRKDEVL